MASSSCYDTVYISNVYYIVVHVIGGGVISKNTKNASKKERVHGLHILLYALCLAFFRQRLSLSKKSRQEDVMSALVTVADSSFLGNVISSRGLL